MSASLTSPRATRTAPRTKVSAGRGGRSPKYLQLAEQIREQVEAGVRLPGEQLPSFAQMQAEHNLSQSTVEKMYRVLEQQKLIVREPGRGVYIARRSRVNTGLLGLLANHAPENHPYYSNLLAGTRAAARSEGMEVLLLNEMETANWDRIDGVLLCIAYAEQLLDALPPGLQRVSMLYPVDGIPTVATDDYQGMSEAVEHLVALGHRRIAYITAAMNRGADALSHQRLRAYRDVMASHGIKPEPRWTQPLRGPYDPLKPFLEAGREKMRRWLRDGWEQAGCTAILTQNDDAAIGVIEALQEAGLSVPGDVSVVGFDGTETATYFRPRLTTVQVPLYEIGKAGTEMLIRQINQASGEANAGNGTNGHGTNGHGTNGHGTNGHAVNGHANNGSTGSRANGAAAPPAHFLPSRLVTGVSTAPLTTPATVS